MDNTYKWLVNIEYGRGQHHHLFPQGDTLKYGIQLRFPATNNEAEYKMILTRLRVAKALGAKNVLLKSDSRLVVRQINEEFEAKENRMQKYLKLTNQLIGEFDQVSFVQIL